MAGSHDAVGNLAAQLPGYDAAPVIRGMEDRLAQYLNTPTADILGQLGLPVPAGMPQSGPIPGLPEIPGLPNGGNLLAPLNGDQLVQPLLDALGTLGTGLSEAFDPTQIFSAITSAISSAGSTLSSVVSAVMSEWQGDSSESATAKTTKLAKDGTKVSTQSGKIKENVVEAGVDTKTTEAQLTEILTAFQAEMAVAAGTSVVGAGPILAITAAVKAITMTTTVMAAHKGKMAINALKVASDGTPVDISDSSKIPTEYITAAVSAGTGVMQTGVSLAGSAFTTGQKTVKAVTDAGAKFNESLAKEKKKAAGTPNGKTPGSGTPHAPGRGAGVGGGAGGKGTGAKGGGGGGGGVSAVAAPLSPRTGLSGAPLGGEGGGQQTGANGRTVAASTTTGTAGGMGATPMGGAPMGAGAGAGAGAGKSGGHSAADFLHTAEGGDQIVGDFADVAPAVIGEVDDQQVISPDIDLRI